MAGIGSRKQIVLVNQTPTKSGANWIANETTILRTWANVKVKNAFRGVQDNQTVLGKLFEFRFRYNGNITITADVKLVYNGNRYAIQSLIRDNEKNFYWILTAQAKSFE